MNQNLESIFCLFLGKRRTKRQKTNFLKKCIECFELTGYAFEISKAKTVVSENINLYFGNLKKAKIVICAYYDTPDKNLFIKQGYFPFDGERNNKIKIKEKLWLNLLFYILFIPLLYIILLDKIEIFIYPLPIKIVFILFVILMGIKINTGFQNSLNFNRNNSSIITMIQHANKNKGDKQIAYAFIDGGVSDHLGAKLLANDIGNNDCLVIFLDCVGYGDDVIVGISSHAKKPYKSMGSLIEENKFTDSYFFTNYAVITVSDKKEDIKETVIHHTGTKKDITLDYEVIEKVLGNLNDFISVNN